jgi:hypothetical protein
MTLRMPTPPGRVFELAQQATHDISSAALAAWKTHPDEVRKHLVVSHPLKVYVLGTLPMLQRKSLKGATPVAWRFLVLRRKQAVAFTEIALKRGDRGLRWVHTGYNPRDFGQLKAAKRLMSRAEVRKGNYELRFLRIPGLDLNGLLWLHSLEDGKDRVVQLGKSPLLRAGWPYTIESLLAKLVPHAEQRHKQVPLSVRRPSGGAESQRRNRGLVQLQRDSHIQPSTVGGKA